MKQFITKKTSCPVCGGSDSIYDGVPRTSSITKYLLKNHFAVLKCAHCGFYYVYPEIKFSREEWASLYGNAYFEPIMTQWWLKKRQRDRKQRLDWLEQTIHPQKIINYLEIGCGEGFVLIDALARGWKVQGVDIQDLRIDRAKNDNISFIKGDLLEINFPENSYDSIYIDSALEHVPSPMLYLKEVKRILRPGGVVYIGVPNEDCLINVAKMLFYKTKKNHAVSVNLRPFVSPYHINGFTKKSLKEALYKVGFETFLYRNFAGHYGWLKHRVFTRPFLLEFLVLPIHLLAIPLRKQVYLEAICVNPKK